MIEEIKKIKMEVLNEEKIQYEERNRTIRLKSYEIRSKLSDLKLEQAGKIAKKETFSFLEKWITRRYEYKRYKEQSKRMLELPRLISKLEEELETENKNVEQILKETGISEKLYNIEEEMYSIENAKTLREIGISPIEAITLLENNEIQPILSESDKYVFSNPRNYDSKSALIGVHKTKYAPTANMVKSAKDSNVKYTQNITLNGVLYEYSYKTTRDTVHMSMNDEVSSHIYGSWEDCKYAVLIPFDDIPNEKIGRAAPMDTFTRGSLELTENSWILCPKNEVNRLKKFNPKVHVLGYEGDSVKGYSQPFLSQLGYCAEEVGMWNWQDKESAQQFYELMSRENIKTGTHTYTYFHEDENMLTRINKAVSLSKLLRDNHLITNQENIENIINQLEDNEQSFGSILSGLCEKSMITGDIEPQAIVGNKKQVDIFLEKMEDSGFNISPAYQNIMKNLCKVSIHDCNKNNQNEVFVIPEKCSEEETKTIAELQKGLVSDSWIDADKARAVFNKFISTAIFDSILHFKEREISKEDTVKI